MPEPSPGQAIEEQIEGRPSSVRFSRLRLTQERGGALSIVLLIVIFSYIQPRFTNPSNFLNITRQKQKKRKVVGTGKARGSCWDQSLGTL